MSHGQKSSADAQLVVLESGGPSGSPGLIITMRTKDIMGFSITLQPGNHTFTAEDGETILEAARRNGHDLPHGCNDGACSMCKGNLIYGKVDYGKSTEIALPPEDREAGMVLFCCATPLSDVVIERRESAADWNMLDYDSPLF